MKRLQKKVSVDLNIRAVNINNLKQDLDILILWKRGNQSIDTKEQKIGPEKPNAVFNEKFRMKTAIDWDSLRNKFGKKKALLAVVTKDRSTQLGEANFDLGHYANVENATTDKLPLLNCESDPKAYIEIFIRAKAVKSTKGDESVASKPTPGSRMTTKKIKFDLPVIEEKASEFDTREEFERAEQEYLAKIKRLEETVVDMNKIVDHK